MIDPSETLYFVHISDTHFGPARDFSRHRHFAYPCAQKVVDIINELPTVPDFVIHTGDVTNQPDVAAYELAQEVFSRLQVPIYYVTGNHDEAGLIEQYLPMGEMTRLLPGTGALCYRFEKKGYRFLILDGRGPDDIDPHGILSGEQLAIVRKETAAPGPPLTLFIHYPILHLNSPWMDENMLLLNGEELHAALLPLRERLRGVFHGHVHQSMQTVRDGITYTAVPSTFSQFGAWPVDEVTSYDPDYLPGFNFVQLLPQQTIVHQHTFPRPVSLF